MNYRDFKKLVYDDKVFTKFDVVKRRFINEYFKCGICGKTHRRGKMYNYNGDEFKICIQCYSAGYRKHRPMNLSMMPRFWNDEWFYFNEKP